MSIAVVFPGQGSQYVGMGLDLYEGNERANAVIAAADFAFGRGLKDVMFLGPEEELKKTHNTQPAILTASAAAYDIIREKLAGKVAYFAGHSLGEYTALYAAGVMDFETAVKLVKRRGELMQEASTNVKSGMAAVLNLDMEAVKKLCEMVKPAGYMGIANINSPGQIVVSGDMAAIDAGEAAAKELGAKRYVKLPVAGAFHSEVMRPAADGLKSEINKFAIKDAVIPVVANVTASEITKADDIKTSLVSQVVSSVRWVECVEYMMSKGVDTFIEVGPGNVLSGLIKKIDKNLKAINVGKLEEANNFTI